MPLARLVTRRPEDAATVEQYLLDAGYTVEIVSPGDLRISPAELEITVDACTREEALKRAAELAREQGADVFVQKGVLEVGQRKPLPLKAAAPHLGDGETKPATNRFFAESIGAVSSGLAEARNEISQTISQRKASVKRLATKVNAWQLRWQQQREQMREVARRQRERQAEVERIAAQRAAEERRAQEEAERARWERLEAERARALQLEQAARRAEAQVRAERERRPREEAERVRAAGEAERQRRVEAERQQRQEEEQRRERERVEMQRRMAEQAERERRAREEAARAAGEAEQRRRVEVERRAAEEEEQHRVMAGEAERGAEEEEEEKERQLAGLNAEASDGEMEPAGEQENQTVREAEGRRKWMEAAERERREREEAERRHTAEQAEKERRARDQAAWAAGEAVRRRALEEAAAHLASAEQALRSKPSNRQPEDTAAPVFTVPLSTYVPREAVPAKPAGALSAHLASRSREWKTAAILASGITLGLMLGWVAFTNRRPASPVPSGSTAIEQQVPFGPASIAAKPKPVSASMPRVPSRPASPAPATQTAPKLPQSDHVVAPQTKQPAGKPTPKPRRRVRAIVAEDDGEPDVVIRHYGGTSTRRPPAAEQKAGLRRYSDLD